ncbi:MAG: alpha/beta hydrolase-fold protein [Ignavibacteriaceae bacterium]
MIKISFIFSILILLAVNSFGGQLIHSKINSKELNREWNYTIFLPEGYSPQAEAYPVIYFLHGNGDDENAWQIGYDILDSLIWIGKIPPVIAVTPSGERGWWVNTLEHFESAVINELIPLIDSSYNTIRNRDGKMIAGFSMGGYGALRYALVYPNLFSSCAIFSPALYNEEPPESSSSRSLGAFGSPFDLNLWNKLNYPETLKLFEEKNLISFFFIGAGDDDWNNPEGVKYNVELQCVFLYQELQKKRNLPAELRIINGGHSWEVWKPLFTEAIQIMLKDKLK